MNSDLSFDGKVFISVNRASELTGYTQDYLGQLCRGGRVPSKMIGRTWYIDHDAVMAHKQNPKSRKAKIAQKPELKAVKNDILQDFLSFQEKLNYISPFKFEKDTSPILPSLNKLMESAKSPARVGTTPYLVASVLVVFALISWINLLSPRAAEISTRVLRSELGHLTLLSASAAAAKPAVREPAVNGLVVFPDPVQHDQAVQSVENSFSDAADVTFDQNGTSGVITPVFRSGNGSTSYAFVMVPINKKAQ